MRHRDWGSGEDSPRERRPSGSWDDPAGPRGVEPYASERSRTQSRRRAIERGQDEPVDAYLPRWAVESGISRADGGGRHAAPDDDEVEPYSAGDRRPEADRRRDGGRRELRAIGAGPVSDHTAEWTMDAPQEQGYVGSRRAEGVEDGPVSGVAPRARPRRAASRKPQVTWSGLADEAGPVDDSGGWEAERPTRRSRRAGSDSAWSPQPAAEPSRSRPAAVEPSWLQPAVDPWERGRAVEPGPAEPPAVDPWDASGVHAWGRAATGSRWDRSESRWDRTEHTGEWDRFTDTGHHERVRDGGDRYAGVDPWDRTAPPVREGWASPERAEEFWSGTRLAGDDPRWMETPPSAPRSPMVAYTAPRPRAAPRRRPVEPVRSGGSALRQRVETIGAGSWSRRLEDDLLDPDPGGPLRPLVYTAACYLVPAVLLFLGLVFLNGQAPAGCVTDLTGGGCDSPRAHALASLLAAAPRFGLAMVSSLVVAVLLRQVGTTWRSATVALAAAVVGGGLSTVVISAVTGQPIG
ncbi:hypothetical protein O7600_18365 [Micromonospora sp. WMMA1998]|uniref:hypothetical protein n=1 Tax=Micromonospora sp. WMMA1998 TaxID=3015167 RepID=UPI00248ABDE9|nr:hypothetical protein [Micromonospora sp. WMMA1998]WBC13119.1 hypothetical protein O7600_18365 [Micromonospora sp. WMMA1998]